MYKNNIKPGTATVSVIGIGSYAGMKNMNFEIKVRKNTTFTSGALKYKVTSINKNKGNVTVRAITRGFEGDPLLLRSQGDF